MQTELLSGRRLRFELRMNDDESVPGAIARGVRQHVLVRTGLVLGAAGVRLRHAGYAQLASQDEIERLAYVLRCSPENLAANVGERVDAAERSRSNNVRFGPNVVPRILLEFDRRRIGPISLRERNYHRINWLNLLLPYCPESLERLTSSCSRCNSTLGWHYSKGIDFCEYCSISISPSIEPAFPQVQADDYRLFAKLSSPMASQVDEAYATLPERLRLVTPDTLVRLVHLLGGLAQEVPVSATNTREVIALPAFVRGSIVARGTSFLRSWPDGFQTWLNGRWDDLQGRQADVPRLRRLIIRAGNRHHETSDLVDIMEDALPTFRKHAVHGLTGKNRYYLYTEVQKKLLLDPLAMNRLRHWDDIKYRRLTQSTHVKGQFDADQIDELEPHFRGALTLNSCASRMKLPHYAIELCCRPGLLEVEDHPAFVFVKGAGQIRDSSLKALKVMLSTTQSQASKPGDVLPLSVAVKRIGGRLKPWASIFLALLNGEVDYWLKSEDPTPRSILLRPTDLSRFDRVSDGACGAKLDVADTCNQADAAEILNIKSPVLAALSDELGLEFATNGFSLVTDRDAVLDVAANVAFDAEVSWHLGVSFREVERTLVAEGITRRMSGWCRQQLIEKEILPPVPASEHTLIDL